MLLLACVPCKLDACHSTAALPCEHVRTYHAADTLNHNWLEDSLHIAMRDWLAAAFMQSCVKSCWGELDMDLQVWCAE